MSLVMALGTPEVEGVEFGHALHPGGLHLADAIGPERLVGERLLDFPRHEHRACEFTWDREALESGRSVGLWSVETPPERLGHLAADPAAPKAFRVRAQGGIAWLIGSNSLRVVHVADPRTPFALSTASRVPCSDGVRVGDVVYVPGTDGMDVYGVYGL